MFRNASVQARLFLIIANLLPVYGVWFLGWNPRQVFLTYCYETVIAGGFTLLKMAISALFGPAGSDKPLLSRILSGLLLMLFFILHYGLFVFVQVSFFLALHHFTSAGSSIPFTAFLWHPQLYIGNNSLMLLGAFIIGYGFENILNFIMNGAYSKVPIKRLMLEPYLRIFVQQLTVIAGTFVVILGGSKIFILIFALAKIYFIIVFNYEAYLQKGETAAAQRSKA